MVAVEKIDPKLVGRVLETYEKGDSGALVNILHDLQAEFRYLPEPALVQAAEYLEVPVSQVFGVATFYDGFHLEPRGKHICTVCMGTACHVRGAERLVEQLERDFEIPAGSTTEDLQVTLEQVSCVGACALGPLVIVDGKYHGHMTTSGVSKLAKKVKKAKKDD